MKKIKLNKIKTLTIYCDKIWNKIDKTMLYKIEKTEP